MKRFRRWARVRVPASTSNLGAGFDVLGLALGLYNEVEVQCEAAERASLRIQISGEGADTLPRDGRNVIWKAMASVFRRAGLSVGKFDFAVKFTNRIPLARGLGSSAAAQLGGVLAANAICGDPLSREQILADATALEGHPDNVVPSLVGGLCLSAVERGQVRYLKLQMPRELAAVACVPAFELATENARRALPKRYSRADAVFNVSRVSLFLGALLAKDYRFLRLGMEDRIHQPYRKKLIPGFDAVIDGAYKAGALGAALSGAGPTMFALAPRSKARAVGEAMRKGFLTRGKASQSLVLPFDSSGAQVRWK